ncbi:Piso0_002447 [Millerozyma farinosa CBS 7064]|uniref:Trimethyllysine dioxygenase n=1 Tax=Pichia sorbitophila (strain ATCC MYA-4447 / BCRC 22081 / CBS 7064 / NBRC 10061 / NRRL Y-12695) TaxID=559304 RepID=G8YF26_PICSO|nr:Piso0_002447 [Millerozyma farinosa CBS 7064]
MDKASKIIKETKVSTDGSQVLLTWDSGITSKYHNIWLRDNCRCEECYYDVTKQRLFNSCLIPDDIKPVRLDITPDRASIKIVWSQKGHESKYGAEWLFLHSYDPKIVPRQYKVSGEKDLLDREFWTVDTIKDNLPHTDFGCIIRSSEESDSEDAIRDWCFKIWKYGFCFIDNVPVDPEETEKLCEKICYIRPTHYGGFWDFTSDLSKNDTAYTNIDIASHTDGTYWSDTPGLQLFHLLYHDGTGGTTSLVDAFQCAMKMKREHPEHFDILTKIPVDAHSAGEDNVCIQPDIPQPIFKLDNEGELIQVRWNQSDRSTMSNWSSPDDVPKFYNAIKCWYKIISDPANEFFYQLRPGQCLIFDNWRCFHSRTEFTGKRRMCGAYINRDDFVSRVRLLNLGRDAILATL